VTVGGNEENLSGAFSLVPALEARAFAENLGGLRPVLRPPSIWVQLIWMFADSHGHFRSGILLTPVKGPG